MEIENAFTVGTPVEDLWRYLLDVERIAPCMPGAELTEIVDDHTWKGLLHMKFGPVALSFAGTVTMQDRDDTARRVTLRAQGMEQKGKGAANATVTSWLEPAEDGRSSVHMKADITLTGAAAQLSRGLIPEVSRKLTQQFADCLEDTLNAEAAAGAAAAGVPGETPAVAPAPAAAKPVGGIGLGLAAIWSLIVNFFKRLFGGGRRAGA